MQVQVCISILGGLIDEVRVFTNDEKALDYLSSKAGVRFNTVEEFSAWQEEIAGDENELHWHSMEVE